VASIAGYDSATLSPPHASAIIATSPQEFAKTYASQEYVKLDGKWIRRLDVGRTTIYFAVRDGWGNELKGHRTYYVVPGVLVTGLAVPSAWFLLLFVTIMFAPTNRFARRLLMSPAIRKYGFFGLVPIIVVIRPIKQRFLAPYRRGVALDKALNSAQTTYVLPSIALLPATTGIILSEHRRIFVRGPSGIGKTAYLKYLLHAYASSTEPTEPPGVTAIYVPLVRFRQESPVSMIHAQLASFGDVTDAELTATMLDDGAFLVLFDGLNEIEAPLRDSLSAFIERYGGRNYFVVASQEEYPEFTGCRLEMIGLDEEHIKALLRARLPRERAAIVIGKLLPEHTLVYRVPQDLELGIQLLLLDEALELPASRVALYEAAVMPLERRWAGEGRGELWSVLTSEALAMVVEHRFTLDMANDYIRAAKTALVDLELIKERTRMYYFRHEQVRAFFAAKTFMRQWRAYMEGSGKGRTEPDEIEVDPRRERVDVTWLPMLEFAALMLDDTEALALWAAIAKRDTAVAIELYRALYERDRKRYGAWTEDIQHEIGAAVVREVQSTPSGVTSHE
jgi:hypothetical protein